MAPVVIGSTIGFTDAMGTGLAVVSIAMPVAGVEVVEVEVVELCSWATLRFFCLLFFFVFLGLIGASRAGIHSCGLVGGGVVAAWLVSSTAIVPVSTTVAIVADFGVFFDFFLDFFFFGIELPSAGASFALDSVAGWCCAEAAQGQARWPVWGDPARGRFGWRSGVARDDPAS